MYMEGVHNVCNCKAYYITLVTHLIFITVIDWDHEKKGKAYFHVTFKIMAFLVITVNISSRVKTMADVTRNQTEIDSVIYSEYLFVMVTFSVMTLHVHL
jgi:hypothetical protein